MESVNFVVLGDQNIASNLGRKSTETDLTFYSKKESDVIRTWVVPNGFPEKIQPLFQAIGLGEFAILHIAELDRFAGEQIVALDSLEKNTGILSHSHQVDEDTLNAMIKGTVIAGYANTEYGKIREEIGKIKPVSVSGKTRIVIDHCFDVKGVGTVVLGKVVSGMVRQYDNLKLFPSGVDVMIKSIQMHDEPVKQAASPARVGLSLRGVRPDQVTRGDILGEDDSVFVTSEISLEFAKTPYYKKDITKDQTCMVNVGLKTVSGRIMSTSNMKVRLDKPVAWSDGDIGTVLSPESASIRMAGSGKIRS